MLGTSPLFAKPAYQVASAVLLVTAGALVLSNLPQSASTLPAVASAEPMNAEAVFTSTPRQRVEETNSTEARRTVSKPKMVAAVPTPPRKPETLQVHQAEVAAPLSIVPPANQTEATVPASTGVIGTLRSVGTTVQQLPQRTYSRVANWFSSDVPSQQPDAPPRPPADVPQNKAAM